MEDLQQLQQPALKPAIDKIIDGSILLTDTVQDIEQSRRELYKSVLPEGWKGLLAKPEDTHGELFGNIEARLKDCQAETKLQEQGVEERAKEIKPYSAKPFASKRKMGEFSGGNQQSASKGKQQSRFKNKKHFPKQSQGPVGKRSERRWDYRGRCYGH